MRRLLPLGTAALLAGCSLAPHYVRPALPVPPSWPVGDAYLRQSEETLPAVTYRQIFQDPRLQTLIAQALANNRDLRAAAANIEEAQAQYRIQRAAIFPEVDANARYSYSHGGDGATSLASGGGTGTSSGSDTGSTGTTGTGTTGTAGTTGTGATGTGTNTGTGTVVTSSSGSSAYSVDLGVTAFELDLFGRVRSLTTAALDRYFETEAAARSTRLSIVGQVATAWLTYASDQSILSIDRQTVASATQSVKLTQARLSGGIAPRTDLLQAQQVLQSAAADEAAETTAVSQDVNLLRLLVGAPIDPTLLPASITEAAPTIATLPPGLSSAILLRRPDVVEAEYELKATDADIGVARAELFPQVSLTGVLGFASTSFTSLFSHGAFNYSVAPNASYSIFQAGAARANVRYTRAERDAAVAQYEKAVQTAFRETADALARQGTIAAQVSADRNYAQEAADTLTLVNARYQGGIDTFLSSLDAQRELYTAQRNLIAAYLSGATNLVTLYQVLGGDSLLDGTDKGPVASSPADPADHSAAAQIPSPPLPPR